MEHTQTNIDTHLNEMINIIDQLLKIYKTTENTTEKRYIFSELQGIRNLSRSEGLDEVNFIVNQAFREIMVVK